MANYFVSSVDGSNADNGTTMDLAWATFEHAVEAGGVTAGDFVWTRPNHSEIPVSDIGPNYNGTANNCITVLGWPKPAFSITSATWTNGSTTVDLVLPATLTESGHEGRFVTAPDGNDYFITRVIDSNTFIIDREYAGATVSSNSGAATIKADPYYTEAQAIDDSAWTIKKADWNANNPARPDINFNSTNYQLYMSGDMSWWFQGFIFRDSADGYGIVHIDRDRGSVLFGNIFKQVNNSCLLNLDRIRGFVDQCIIKGNGAGTSQIGVLGARYNQASGYSKIQNSAIYNCGAYGISSTKVLILDNVNIGVEQANGNDDIRNASQVTGKDVKLGGTNGTVFNDDSYGAQFVSIENYQKILGNHRTFFPGGYYEDAAVSGEVPNKKLSDYVIKLTPNISSLEFIPELAVCVFEDEWNNVPAGTYAIGYWIYNDSGVTLNPNNAIENIWLEVEFLSGYDDTSEYVYTKKYSTLEDILDAANADDWDKLLVNSCVVAATSKVRMKIYFSKYLYTTNVFIDTKKTEN